METFTLRLEEIVEHCCDVRTFRFETHKHVAYKPGQYLILTLDINGKDAPKAFSLSSSPTEDGFIQFTKKLTSSDFSNALRRLRVGDVCRVRYPLGKFTLEGEHPRAGFLIGGIGITPVRSIFKNAADRGLDADLVLLYSGRTADQLIFRHEFDEMARLHTNLRVVYTLTQCAGPIEGCRVGYIDEQMVVKEIPDFAQRVFYLCGPPAMVDAMRSLLVKKLSLPADKIMTEDFTGY
ncbi:MAG: ferredoxin--NADP reductase [Deltaproteobacteria bacterium]